MIGKKMAAMLLDGHELHFYQASLFLCNFESVRVFSRSVGSISLDRRMWVCFFGGPQDRPADAPLSIKTK